MESNIPSLSVKVSSVKLSAENVSKMTNLAEEVGEKSEKIIEDQELLDSSFKLIDNLSDYRKIESDESSDSEKSNLAEQEKKSHKKIEKITENNNPLIDDLLSGGDRYNNSDGQGLAPENGSGLILDFQEPIDILQLESFDDVTLNEGSGTTMVEFDHSAAVISEIDSSLPEEFLTEI